MLHKEVLKYLVLTLFFASLSVLTVNTTSSAGGTDTNTDDNFALNPAELLEYQERDQVCPPANLLPTGECKGELKYEVPYTVGKAPDETKPVSAYVGSTASSGDAHPLFAGASKCWNALPPASRKLNVEYFQQTAKYFEKQGSAIARAVGVLGGAGINCGNGQGCSNTTNSGNANMVNANTGNANAPNSGNTNAGNANNSNYNNGNANNNNNGNANNNNNGNANNSNTNNGNVNNTNTGNSNNGNYNNTNNGNSNNGNTNNGNTNNGNANNTNNSNTNNGTANNTNNGNSNNGNANNTNNGNSNNGNANNTNNGNSNNGNDNNGNANNTNNSNNGNANNTNTGNSNNGNVNNTNNSNTNNGNSNNGNTGNTNAGNTNNGNFNNGNANNTNSSNVNNGQANSVNSVYQAVFVNNINHAFGGPSGPSKPPGGCGGGGGTHWGDVHAVAFDGSHWDFNSPQKSGWYSYIADRAQYSNILLTPWSGNKKTTVITGFSLVTNYDGAKHTFLFGMNQGGAKLDGKALTAKSTIQGITVPGHTTAVWYLYDGHALRIITPDVEYAATFISPGDYGNVAYAPRRAPHLDGVFPTGLAGDSIHFIGKPIGESGKGVTTGNTWSIYNAKTGKGSHRVDIKTGYYVGTNAFGLSPVTGYNKTRVPRIDGFFPSECSTKPVDNH